MKIPENIHEVASQYDGFPLIHTRIDDDGQLLYFHWVDLVDEDTAIIWAVFETTEENYAQLIDNKITFEEFFDLSKSRKAVKNALNTNTWTEISFEEALSGLPEKGVKFN